jgi:hypothetical protein
MGTHVLDLQLQVCLRATCCTLHNTPLYHILWKLGRKSNYRAKLLETLVNDQIYAACSLMISPIKVKKKVKLSP